MIPRFGIGLNIGVNNGGSMQRGSLQGVGFGKVVEWVGAHLLGKENGAEIRKIVEKTMFDDSLHP